MVEGEAELQREEGRCLLDLCLVVNTPLLFLGCSWFKRRKGKSSVAYYY